MDKKTIRLIVFHQGSTNSLKKSYLNFLSIRNHTVSVLLHIHLGILFENLLLIYHRNFFLQGTTTLSAITAVWLWSFKFKLPPGAKFAANAFGIMAYTQVNKLKNL